MELPEIRWEFDNAAADLSRRVETEAQAIPDLSHEAQCHTAAQMQAALCAHVSLVLQNGQLHVGFASRKRPRPHQHHGSTSPGPVPGSSGQAVGPHHPFPPSTPRRIAPVAPLHAWPASVGSSLSSLSSAPSSYVTTPSEPQQQQQQQQQHQLSQHQLQQQQQHDHHGQQPYLQLHPQYTNQLLPPAAAAADGAPEKRPKPQCRPDSGVVLEREDSVTGSYLSLISDGDFSDQDGFTFTPSFD